MHTTYLNRHCAFAEATAQALRGSRLVDRQGYDRGNLFTPTSRLPRSLSPSGRKRTRSNGHGSSLRGDFLATAKKGDEAISFLDTVRLLRHNPLLPHGLFLAMTILN
tara:strand:- start:512 stop:832 length:321 start_codon:yes stop_codon:yes gene_type:complete